MSKAERSILNTNKTNLKCMLAASKKQQQQQKKMFLCHESSISLEGKKNITSSTLGIGKLKQVNIKMNF